MKKRKLDQDRSILVKLQFEENNLTFQVKIQKR